MDRAHVVDTETRNYTIGLPCLLKPLSRRASDAMAMFFEAHVDAIRTASVTQDLIDDALEQDSMEATWATLQSARSCLSAGFSGSTGAVGGIGSQSSSTSDLSYPSMDTGSLPRVRLFREIIAKGIRSELEDVRGLEDLTSNIFHTLIDQISDRESPVMKRSAVTCSDELPPWQVGTSLLLLFTAEAFAHINKW